MSHPPDEQNTRQRPSQSTSQLEMRSQVTVLSSPTVARQVEASRQSYVQLSAHSISQVDTRAQLTSHSSPQAISQVGVSWQSKAQAPPQESAQLEVAPQVNGQPTPQVRSQDVRSMQFPSQVSQYAWQCSSVQTMAGAPVHPTESHAAMSGASNVIRMSFS